MKSSGLKGVLEKLRSRDDRLLWTVNLTAERKLRFQISQAIAGHAGFHCPGYFIVKLILRSTARSKFLEIINLIKSFEFSSSLLALPVLLRESARRAILL